MQRWPRSIRWGALAGSALAGVLLFAATPAFAQLGNAATTDHPWYDTFSQHPIEWLTVLFSGLLVLFTATLFLATTGLRDSTTKLWETAKDDAATAKQVLVLTQRPRIRVRNVVVRPSSVTGFHPTLFQSEQFITGQLYMANVGGTDATIEEAHCEIFWTNLPLPMERPYEGKDPNSPIRNLVLRPGQSKALLFGSDTVLPRNAAEHIIGGSGWWAYVLGWIQYSDALGTVRRTSFCRKYDCVKKRFFPVEDSDYEHEE